jgi:hypothetical protein
MFSWLQPADKPTIEGLEEREFVFGAKQPQYNPLRGLKSQDEQGKVLTRWELTEEQRKAVADGADIYLELMTFNQGLQPIRIAVGKDMDPVFLNTIHVEYGFGGPVVEYGFGVTCPSCGVGIDTDGDGNCANCGGRR